MIVRPGRHEDVEHILDLGAQMHEEGAYAFLPFDREKVRQLILEMIGDPETQCVLVAEEGGRPVGGLLGYLDGYFFCDEKLACDLVLFIERPHRGGTAAARLIRAFRQWATERGARELCLAISTGVEADRIGRLYERMGLRRVGGVYKQRLSSATSPDSSWPRRRAARPSLPGS
jgi:GNAT superfamily N-acetyltransferase